MRGDMTPRVTQMNISQIEKLNDNYYRSPVNRWHVTVEEKECPTCGKTFISYHEGRIYCSPTCSSKAHYKRMGMTPKDWEILREYILERDNYTCQKCGYFSMTTGMAVHHIIPLCQGGTNDEDNLTTLCNTCHRKSHVYT